MPDLLLLLACPLGALAIAGFLRRRRMLADPGVGTAAEFLAPLLLGLLVYAYAHTLELNTRWPWSAARLAPTLGLVHGYPLYSAPDAGPINGWLYGPVAALAWLPAALADSPRPALAIAAAINLLFLLGPLLFLCLRGGAAPRPARLLAFAAVAGAFLLAYPTWYMASVLCSDAVAVGLGLGSCLLLLGRTAPGPRTLVAAALLAVLAAWTKQIEAPLVLAQLGWLLYVDGARAAARYAALYAAAALVVSGLFLAGFNAHNLVLNAFTIPLAQHYAGGARAFRLEAADFLRYSLPFTLPCLLGLARGGTGGGGRRTDRAALLLLIAAAAVLFPTGVLATIKVGGDRNSVHSLYYLGAAAALALVAAWSAAKPAAPAWRGAILAAATVAVAVAVRQVRGYPRLSMLPPRCASEDAWFYARRFPGRTYFPRDPLCTLMAEGRLYTLEYGVVDRGYAGLVPSARQVAEGLPAQLETVAYPRADGEPVMVDRFLPDFGFAQATPDWLLFRRGYPRKRP
jgi:hypothetical protein